MLAHFCLAYIFIKEAKQNRGRTERASERERERKRETEREREREIKQVSQLRTGKVRGDHWL